MKKRLLIALTLGLLLPGVAGAMDEKKKKSNPIEQVDKQVKELEKIQKQLKQNKLKIDNIIKKQKKNKLFENLKKKYKTFIINYSQIQKTIIDINTINMIQKNDIQPETNHTFTQKDIDELPQKPTRLLNESKKLLADCESKKIQQQTLEKNRWLKKKRVALILTPVVLCTAGFVYLWKQKPVRNMVYGWFKSVRSWFSGE